MGEDDSVCNVDLHYREHEEIYCREQSRHRRATAGLCDFSGSICGSWMHGCRRYIKWLCLITLCRLCDLGECGLLKEPWKSILFQWLLQQMHEWFVAQQQNLRAILSPNYEIEESGCYLLFCLSSSKFWTTGVFCLKKNRSLEIQDRRFEYFCSIV